MLSNRANSLKPICKIDVTPFASVMVFLVALMMVATPSPPNGVAVDLPRVFHPIGMWRANREDALIIGVMRDGQIFFGRDRVRPEGLVAKISERLAHGAKREVYIRADAGARYLTVSVILVCFLLTEKPLPPEDECLGECKNANARNRDGRGIPGGTTGDIAVGERDLVEQL
jgi:biopolymer transport protein ExbD